MQQPAPIQPSLSQADTARLSENRKALEREQRSEARTLFRLTVPSLLIVGLLMVFPIAWLLSMSVIGREGQFSLENYRLFFDEPVYRDMFINTFTIAFIVTAICLLLGYPVAYLLAIMPSPWSGLLMLAVLMPFWTSSLVRTFSWLIILQRNGLINSALVGMGIVDRPIPLVHNMTGTIIGMVHIMVPFLILPLYATMKTIDGNLMRAAANLGSGPVHAFARIYLPLSMPGLIAGTIMVFVMCLGFYITPALLGGGKVQMIAQRIEQSVSLFPTWGPAAALAVVLLVLTGGFLLLSWLIVRRFSRGE